MNLSIFKIKFNLAIGLTLLSVFSGFNGWAQTGGGVYEKSQVVSNFGGEFQTTISVIYLPFGFYQLQVLTSQSFIHKTIVITR